jgi:hypothetical protein
MAAITTSQSPCQAAADSITTSCPFHTIIINHYFQFHSPNQQTCTIKSTAGNPARASAQFQYPDATASSTQPAAPDHRSPFSSSIDAVGVAVHSRRPLSELSVLCCSPRGRDATASCASAPPHLLSPASPSLQAAAPQSTVLNPVLCSCLLWLLQRKEKENMWQ